ncbi:hypothetical protein [Paracnuella aquatica]|uniref:hypothetical protein n=1 Tax=Paracnuella aquatica TaxID=2268757 RepID=UPI000DEEF116|nr:hypothetical protein [Paracnuella aquatica]RPD51529.1 hypothetical protein DRJ53_02290 [Paracnuella aquatica]
MELDDLKTTWNNIGGTAGQQKMDVAQLVKDREVKYGATLRRIILPEILGSIVCVAAAVFIGVQWSGLETTLMQTTGILAITLLVLIPAISFWSTAGLRNRPNLSQPHADTLRHFALQKLQFFKLQKLSVLLSYLLLVAVIVLMSGMYGRNDIAENKYFWMLSITVGYVFLVFYARWVEKYYQKSIDGAEVLLREIGL